MEHDPTMLSQRFFELRDTMAFPQPLVADVIGCDQTELNELRRSNLLIDGWKKNGRVVYTGRGLLTAGVMMELAWLLRPREAAQYAEAFNGWFDECAVSNSEEWSQRIAYFSKPFLKKDDDNAARLVTSSDEFGDGFGRIVRFVFRKDLERPRSTPKQTSLILPIGQLVRGWSENAMQQLDKADS